MTRAAALATSPRVPIETIGLRPGEKVREELTNQGLEMKRTTHHRIWRARQQDVPRLEVYRALRRLTRACAQGDTAGVLNAIRLAVSDYVPSDAVLELTKASEAADSAVVRGGRL